MGKKIMEKATTQSKEVLWKNVIIPPKFREGITYKTRENEMVFLNDRNTKFETYVDEEKQKNVTYFSDELNNSNKNMERYSDVCENEIADQFRSMQEKIMREEVPVLTRLLEETTFDDGYESAAEKYFNELYDKHGIIADTVLLNIYLENMYDNKHILKHLLFIVSGLSKKRRKNLEIIPLAGISNPDIEIKDLSVKCFETWEDKRHIPTLKVLLDNTDIRWFKDYISEVIESLEEE